MSFINYRFRIHLKDLKLNNPPIACIPAWQSWPRQLMEACPALVGWSLKESSVLLLVGFIYCPICLPLLGSHSGGADLLGGKYLTCCGLISLVLPAHSCHQTRTRLPVLWGLIDLFSLSLSLFK